MQIIKTELYQCAECYISLQATIIPENKQIKYLHPKEDFNYCNWQETYFLVPIQIQNVLGLKDN